MFDRSTLDDRLAEARKLFPIGCQVIFQPVKGHPKTENSRVRSAPWALGHGEIVVAIEGRAGGVAVSHLTVARHPATNIGE
ncbi:MAG: hypothetical protein V4586_14820 [Pseudomonadota bacterium]